jgi:CelD/BcsL family acetyltransferase involved in cellulose biosynthesis
MFNVVRMCCERGLTSFDLGVGEARFKRLFCRDPEPLFDTFIGLTRQGHAAAWLCRGHQTLKRRIKHSPSLWQALSAARRRMGATRRPAN